MGVGERPVRQGSSLRELIDDLIFIRGEFYCLVG